MVKTVHTLLNADEAIIMGILNLTPDSFYDGGRYATTYLSQVEKMLDEGAGIIDVGAISSRPGASLLTEREEVNRLKKPIGEILKRFPDIILSIDTFRQNVAAHYIKQGVSIINDISGGMLDKKMIPFVDKYHIPYVMMHMQGRPQNMQEKPIYKNVTEEIKAFFKRQLNLFQDPGNVILDPGFGFGKTLEHNNRLLDELSSFQELKQPILVGTSRKSMIYNLLNITPQEALNGTTVVNTIALLNGAKILRVHDVKEAKQCIAIFRQLSNN